MQHLLANLVVLRKERKTIGKYSVSKFLNNIYCEEKSKFYADPLI